MGFIENQITTALISVSLLLSALEYLLLARERAYAEVWSDKNLAAELPGIVSFNGFKVAAFLQFNMALSNIIFPHYTFIIGLLFTHLYLCVRARGTFNGGSDMMTFVVLTGLLIPKYGLIYIAIHGILSYFKTGFAKVMVPEWRNGKALSIFLGESVYPDIRKFSSWLKPHIKTNILLSWTVIVGELATPFIFLSPKLFPPFMFIAVLFHFMNFFVFGLNRFIFVWVAVWPAIYYGVKLAS